MPGIGVRTSYWHGAMAWAEAGNAMSYLNGHRAAGLPRRRRLRQGRRPYDWRRIPGAVCGDNFRCRLCEQVWERPPDIRATAKRIHHADRRPALAGLLERRFHGRRKARSVGQYLGDRAWSPACRRTASKICIYYVRRPAWRVHDRSARGHSPTFAWGSGMRLLVSLMLVMTASAAQLPYFSRALRGCRAVGPRCSHRLAFSGSLRTLPG